MHSKQYGGILVCVTLIKIKGYFLKPGKPVFIIVTRPTPWRTDANLYPLERQLTKASEPLFDLEGGAQGQI